MPLHYEFVQYPALSEMCRIFLASTNTVSSVFLSINISSEYNVWQNDQGPLGGTP
jgi:hypothetical protein